MSCPKEGSAEVVALGCSMADMFWPAKWDAANEAKSGVELRVEEGIACCLMEVGWSEFITTEFAEAESFSFRAAS